MPRSISFQLLALIVFCGPVALSLRAQGHAVRFERQAKKGERFEVQVVEKDQTNTKTLFDGKVTEEKNEEIETSLEAIKTVVEVDGQNKVQRVRWDIGRLVQKFGGEQAEHVVLAKGAVVETYLEKGKQVFLVNGKPVAGDTADVLDDLMGFSKSDVSDEDIFGSKVKRKVGERWSINREQVAKSFSESKELQVAANEVVGHVTLVSTEQIEGKKYLTVAADVKLGRVFPKERNGYAYPKSKMHGTFRRRYADDPAVGHASETLKMMLDLELVSKATQDIPAFKMLMKTNTTETRSFRLMR